MSDGKTHEKYAIRGLIGLTGGCIFAHLVYNAPVDIYILIPGGVFAFLIDSDMLDMHQIRTHGERRLYRWFWPLGFIVEMYSWPLAKLVKHRSVWSHLPPVNSTIRLLYYVGLPAIVVSMLGMNLPHLSLIQSLFFLSGAVVVDFIHLWLDKFELGGFK